LEQSTGQFSGLTLLSILDFPLITPATIKGHLDQHRQNKEPSTKSVPIDVSASNTNNNQPKDIDTNNNKDTDPTNEEPTKYCYAALLPIEKQGKCIVIKLGVSIQHQAWKTPRFLFYMVMTEMAYMPIQCKAKAQMTF
jgi:hypothetical protein